MSPELPPGLRASLDEAAARVRSALALDRAPDVGWVLGSGLGDVAGRLDDARRVAYADVPGLAAPGVAGHAGEITAGQAEGRTVLALRGRAHLYEGHPVERVVFGVRLLAHLGAPVVALTNAAGGIAPTLGAGSLLLIADHLNLTGRNPLVFEGRDATPPFVDLRDAWDPVLRRAAREVAASRRIPIVEGVYAGLLGPSYETPAEIRMLATMGADAVGMSTVLEAIALRHLGVRVMGLSSITNVAAGRPGAVLDHDDVQRVARANADRVEAILRGVTAETPTSSRSR